MNSMSANGRARFEMLGHRRRPAQADEIVRILTLGQEREAQAFARADQRQRRLDGAERRPPAGAVAVEAQDRLARHRPQQRALVGGERGAERRDDVGEAGFAHRDRVDIALDDDDRAAVMRALAGAVMIEQQRAFVEERGLRRIEVFRLGARLHRPPAEGDDAAGAVVDRKHHPVAEPVVRNRDVFAVDEQAGFDHRLGADALGRERVAQRESAPARHSRAQSAAARGRRGRGRRDSRAPLAPIGCCRFASNRRAATPGLRSGSRASCLRPPRRRLAAASAGPPCRRAARPPPGKLRPSVSIRKAKIVAVLAGREVMEEALLVVDEERGRLLRGERRQAAPFAPCLAQFDPLPRHLRDRQPGHDLVEKFGRELHEEPDWPSRGLWQARQPRCPPAFARPIVRLLREAAAGQEGRSERRYG